MIVINILQQVNHELPQFSTEVIQTEIKEQYLANLVTKLYELGYKDIKNESNMIVTERLDWDDRYILVVQLFPIEVLEVNENREPLFSKE